ncbi:MAG: hypothetical protein J0H19_25440 [Rhodospirillales bacterium]|nr:hypothetical protein [Rhodospirillales bacterium]MBN8929950.1 hypothetical protein [Rhodospirillales bacterium]
MENVEELLTRAGRYRDLARQVTDEGARSALLDLAAEYEKLAQEAQDRGDEQVE